MYSSPRRKKSPFVSIRDAITRSYMWLFVLTAFVILLCCFLLGSFLSLTYRANKIKNHLEKREQLTVYVNGDTGKDSNPGTIGKPVKTILGAANRARELANGPDVVFSNGSYIWPDADEIEDSALKDLGLFDGSAVIGNKFTIYEGFNWSTVDTTFPVTNYTLSSPNDTFVDDELVGKFVQFFRSDGTPTTQNDYRLILANQEGSITILGPEVSADAAMLNVFDINTTFVLDSSQDNFYFLGGETFSLFKYITFSLEGGTATPGASQNMFSMIAGKVLGHTTETWQMSSIGGGVGNYEIVLFEDVNSMVSQMGAASTSVSGSWIRNTNPLVFSGTSAISTAALFYLGDSKWDTQQAIQLNGEDVTISNSFIYSAVGFTLQLLLTSGRILDCELGVRGFGLDILRSNAMQVGNVFIHAPTPANFYRLIVAREGSFLTLTDDLILGYDINTSAPPTLGKFLFLITRATVVFNAPSVVVYGTFSRIFHVVDSPVTAREFDLSVDASLSENPLAANSFFLFFKTSLQMTNCNWAIDGITAPLAFISGSIANIQGGTIEITSARTYAINVDFGSSLQLFDDVVTILECTTTRCIVVSQASYFIARGTTNITSEAGTCVTIDRLCQATFTNTSNTNVLCGVEEFSILRKSKLLVSGTGSVTLDPLSVNQTSVGSRTNATSLFLGTSDTSYVDGLEGLGIQQCSLRVS